MTNSYELALRVSVGIVVALAFVWTTLIIALVFLRPKGGLLREAMRILPDTIRLLRRLATDRSIGVGVRVRLWLLPAIFWQSAFAEAGGLLAYDPSLPDQLRPIGVLAGKILKGTKPAELPVKQPTKFELVVNVRTAMQIGVLRQIQQQVNANRRGFRRSQLFSPQHHLETWAEPASVILLPESRRFQLLLVP